MSISAVTAPFRPSPHRVLPRPFPSLPLPPRPFPSLSIPLPFLLPPLPFSLHPSCTVRTSPALSIPRRAPAPPHPPMSPLLSAQSSSAISFSVRQAYCNATFKYLIHLSCTQRPQTTAMMFSDTGRRVKWSQTALIACPPASFLFSLNPFPSACSPLENACNPLEKRAVPQVPRPLARPTPLAAHIAGQLSPNLPAQVSQRKPRTRQSNPTTS